MKLIVKRENVKVKEFIKNEVIYSSDNLIKNPIVSIILPTYCRGDNGLLKRSIKSILEQEFTDWELIIVDDGSIDSTKDIVKSFMKQDTRIVYIRNEINSGLPAIRVNQGILHARGKYIAYQFDDDYLYSNMLMDLYREIKKLNEASVVYGKCKIINSIKKIENQFGREFNKSIIDKANIIPNNAVLHNKEIPYLYGGYESSIPFRRLSDWDLWRRWANYVPFIYVDKFVSVVEIEHEHSLTRTCNVYKNLLEEMQKINRCNELSLYNINEYEIDNIQIINDKELRKNIIDYDILPWYKNHKL